MKFELSLNDEELKELNGDRDKLINILISRALYNESLDISFSDTQKKEMWYLCENEIIKLFIEQTVKPRLAVTENDIIEAYNQNKEIFDKENVKFSQAREIIKQQLTAQVNYSLSEDLIKHLINEMDDKVSISKEDILFSHGNPDVLKTLIIINLIKENKKSQQFFESNKEIIDTIEKNVRVNYYIELKIRSGIEVTEEEVNNIYEKEKENEALAKLNENEAKNVIANQLIQLKSNILRNKISQEAYEKYNLESIVEKYLGKEEKTDEK